MLEDALGGLPLRVWVLQGWDILHFASLLLCVSPPLVSPRAGGLPVTLADALGGGWLTLHARRCLGWPTLAGLGLARVGHSSLCFSPSLCLSSLISPRDRCQSILARGA